MGVRPLLLEVTKQLAEMPLSPLFIIGFLLLKFTKHDKQ